MQNILLATPPFTQLNTPYPATVYLKGFLNTQNIPSNQVDLGIELVLKLFSSKGLEEMFAEIEMSDQQLSLNSRRMIRLKQHYLDTIDAVILFLQNKNSSLAYAICERDFLPEAGRFTDETNDLEWAFGTMGLHDKARHLATLYLEDLSDLIVEAVDPYFGFSRYAERLGRCATSFDALAERLAEPDQLIDRLLKELLLEKIDKYNPTVLALSVPFPGNLYGALKCAQTVKELHPHIKIVMGGGFPNTELRTLREEKVFEFVDYVTLDDGEAPLKQLVRYLDGEVELKQLKRTFVCEGGEVRYIDDHLIKDFRQSEVGTPDYSDLPLDEYLSVIEVVNPMHRLWSDGRWNKLTLAHGCYWGNCTFCDTTLDYISRYEANTASMLCDRMEAIIAQTGQNGFHFVDEAAPPVILKELSLEILRRGLRVVWWGNIRFEKSYTFDLIRLMKAAGCIAVSGGLEVASDRLLALIRKGVSVSQVANVANYFTQNGIMVHAYLMYGFPTQTERETVDALEMVRQLFENGVLQSGFWHLFTLTAHSPVGHDPERFGITKRENEGKFANNDLVHFDPTGAEHQKFGDGLRKALYNYMHEAGFDMPLQNWFDFKIPATTIPPNYIFKAINDGSKKSLPLNKQLFWIGEEPVVQQISKQKKGKSREFIRLTFHLKTYDLEVEYPIEIGKWITQILRKTSLKSDERMTLQEVKDSFELNQLGDFDTFWLSKSTAGLLSSDWIIC